MRTYNTNRRRDGISVEWDGERIGFDAELTIKRSDFGMNKMLQFVGDDVKLYISVEGVRE